MSVHLDVYPELLNPGRGLYVELTNPTNTDQDITITFYSDSTPILQIAVEGVPPGSTINFVSPWSLLNLDNYKGRVISLVPSIPAPGSGVYLLGTTVQPSTTGNAKFISIGSSTVTVTFLDPDGKPVENARVNLVDLSNGKTYLYVTDSDGRIELPDRPTSGYGQWILELYEPKPNLGYVLYYLGEYDYKSRTITVQRFRSAYVEIGITMPKTNYLQGLVENAVAYMPEPLKTITRLVAQGLGWLHDTVINTAFSYLTWEISRSGHGVTSCRYGDGFISVGFNVGLTSPFAFAGIAAFLGWLFKWLIGFVVGYVVVRIVESWTAVRVQEELTKQTQILNDQLTQLNNLLNQGKITLDEYNKALDLLRGIKRDNESNVPTIFGVPLTTVVSLIGLVLVVSVVVSVLSAVRR